MFFPCLTIQVPSFILNNCVRLFNNKNQIFLKFHYQDYSVHDYLIYLLFQDFYYALTLLSQETSFLFSIELSGANGNILVLCIREDLQAILAAIFHSCCCVCVCVYSSHTQSRESIFQSNFKMRSILLRFYVLVFFCVCCFMYCPYGITFFVCHST